jgi:hypothetical protein
MLEGWPAFFGPASLLGETDMIRPRNVLTVALAFALLAGSTGCRGKKPAPVEKKEQPAAVNSAPDNGPEVVFNAAMTALKADDHRAFIECFAPEAQKEMAADLVVMGLYKQHAAEKEGRTPEEDKPILEALDKHGLSYKVTKGMKLGRTIGGERRSREEVGALLKDPIAVFVDLSAASRKKRPGGGAAQGRTPTLDDVRIRGDRAHGIARMKQGNRELQGAVDFVKVGGTWKIIHLHDAEPVEPAEDKR